jgi:hypothetical protein
VSSADSAYTQPSTYLAGYGDEIHRKSYHLAAREKISRKAAATAKLL